MRRIAVIGLGYVGLAVASAMAKEFEVVGFDIDRERVAGLAVGDDVNHEIPAGSLSGLGISFTNEVSDIADMDVYIIAVPTPVAADNTPDLAALTAATSMVGDVIRTKTAQTPAPVVVFESTVFPGCTESVCVPILEERSKVVAGTGFKVGYAPERVNPGDADHGFADVVKVVAAQDSETSDLLADLYGKVTSAGVYQAADIRTAEAAKVIENVQRDLNIALMNELAMIFHRLGIDTQEVLKASKTKWNFLPFYPGLVGGHCIPVDPYYLTYAAREVGFDSRLTLVGRETNDGMSRYLADTVIHLMTDLRSNASQWKVLLLGLTFKQNVKDMRNSGAVQLGKHLLGEGIVVDAYDPLVADVAVSDFGFQLTSKSSLYDAIILAVPHRELLKQNPADWLSRLQPESSKVVMDISGAWNREFVEAQGCRYWRL